MLYGQPRFSVAWSAYLAAREDTLMVAHIVERRGMLTASGRNGLNAVAGFETAVWGMAAVLAVILIAAFIGNTLLGGYNFTWYGASFRPAKMNPLSGLKRMFGLQSLVELLKSILKVAVVAGFAYMLLVIYFDDIMALSLMTNPEDIFASAEIFCPKTLVSASSASSFSIPRSF